jgi:hypothetical protein
MYQAEAFKSSFVGRCLSHLDEKPAKRRSGSRRVQCWLQVFEMPTYVQVIFLLKPENQ